MLPCQHGLNACRDLDFQESLGGGWRVQGAGWLWTCHAVDLGMAANSCFATWEKRRVQANVEGRICT